jgi:predicted MFS family arabinose efflux permease
MRKGFSLLIAIIILTTVATLMTLMLSLSGSATKATLDIYFKEQAALLSRSATEYALLAISGHDNSINCIKNINMTYPQTNPTHDINISLMYLGNGINGCVGNVLSNLVDTNESNYTVIIDTIVSVRSDLNLSEPIRIHRRTIQKP